MAGPFGSNGRAVQWLAREHADLAIVDVLLNDGSALRLGAELQREGIPLVFFSGFDARRLTIRAELPTRPGIPRETPLTALLDAFAEAARRGRSASGTGRSPPVPG